GDRLTAEPQPDQAARDAALCDLEQAFPPDELGLREIDVAIESGFERIGLEIDVLPVGQNPGLEAANVTRRDHFQPEVPAGFEHAIPQLLGLAGRIAEIDLVADLGGESG